MEWLAKARGKVLETEEWKKLALAIEKRVNEYISEQGVEVCMPQHCCSY